ncbi:MAG: hypothetical protein ACI8V2_001694 [Candidatus Latescibacterota bacterium]|jgi:hypothetical protein
MSKRAREQRQTPQTSESTPQATITDRLSKPWVPVAFFALLTLLYFYRFIFSGDVIYGSDTGAELQKGQEPFVEKVANIPPANWSRFMGGTPESSGLRAQYFPLHIVALFTSEHRYFGWRYVVAMFCAGYFTFICARALGLHPLAALVAGVAYASAPTFLTFPRAGHFAKMSVISLLPLMYWALYRGMDTKKIIYFLILGGTVGISIYTPHLQMVYFALWALGLLYLYKVVHHYLKEKDINAALYRSLLAAGAICLGLAIGAEGVFPQYWNTKTVTKRAGKEQAGAGYEYASSWSLHPEEIFALVIPEFGGFNLDEGYRYWGRNLFKGNSEYVGIVPLFFGLFALTRIRKKPHIAFLFALFIFTIAYSLGPHTPLHKIFYHIVPGVNVLRVPGMIAFLFSFALCLLSAYGIHRILKADLSPESVRKFLITGGVSAIVLLIFAFAPSALLAIWRSIFWTDMPAQRVQIAQDSLSYIGQGALLAALFVGIMTALSYLRLQNKLQPHVFALILLPLILVDTWRIDKMFLTYVNPNSVLPQERVNPNVINYLKQDTDLFRVLAIPNAKEVPLYGIDLVTGFNDFAIDRYDNILKSGDVNRPAILNLLNTKYLVSKDPLDIPWMQKTGEADNLHIYKNPIALPWFYLAPQYEIITDEDQILERLRDPNTRPEQTALIEEEPGIASDTNTQQPGTVQRLEYNARQGHIKLQTSALGPRILVISQNHHPHWQAFVDGESTPLIRANYLWTAVALSPGEHTVELRYHDPIVATTRWITFAGTGIFIIGLIAFARKPTKDTEDAG